MLALPLLMFSRPLMRLQPIQEKLKQAANGVSQADHPCTLSGKNAPMMPIIARPAATMASI
jgi:hypothetical protein